MAQTINVRITSRSRRGHSTITRNYTNLIRIQRTKSVKTNKTLPNILSLNARSIFQKTDELAHVVYKHNSDVVMVSETWLSDDIPDEALHFPGVPGFSVIRNDRVDKRGGGVAVFIKDTIPFKICRNFSNPNYECLWTILRPKWLPRSTSKIALASPTIVKF